MLGKAKKLLAAAIITAAPLFTLLAPGIAHAATFTCTWTGGGSDNNFSTTANWSGCNGAAPDPLNDTDDLVFPLTATNLTPVNDLSSATFNSITFSGSGSSPYDINGNGFTLAGDVTDSTSQPNVIENNIDVSGTSNISVNASNILDFSGTLSGSGSLVKVGAGQVNVATLTLTGALTVNAGTLALTAQSSADATVSGVTVLSGATFAYDAFTSSGVTAYGLSTPITSAGTLDFQGGSTSGQVLNLTGTLTLTGNTNILASAGTTVHIKGSLVGPGFKVTAAGTGIAFNESTSNTSDTPTGDVMGASTSAPAPTTTPSTPDTGFALAAAHPVVTLALTTLLAGSIFGIAQVNRKLAARR